MLPTEVSTLFVYSYLKNVTQAGRELGWTVTSLYDPDEARGEQRKRAESRPARTQ